MTQYQDNTNRMRMFHCYRQKLRGGKNKDLVSLSYTSLSAPSLRFHMQVSESMRVVSNVTTEKSIAHGASSLVRDMALAKASSTFCCVSVVIMPTKTVLARWHYTYSFWKNWFPSLETLLLFRRLFLREVNTVYIGVCVSSWPLLLAQNVKITSNAGNQKSIRMHIWKGFLEKPQCIPRP